MSTLGEKCGKLYRQIVQFGRDRCEMCGKKASWLPLAVHHPIRKDETYQYDVRNGVQVCNDCHVRYDHNHTLLLRDMREFGIELEQADWIERHMHEVHPQAKALIDHEARHEALKAMLKAIKSGEKKRADFRDWKG